MKMFFSVNFVFFALFRMLEGYLFFIVYSKFGLLEKPNLIFSGVVYLFYRIIFFICGCTFLSRSSF